MVMGRCSRGRVQHKHRLNVNKYPGVGGGGGGGVQHFDIAKVSS